VIVNVDIRRCQQLTGDALHERRQAMGKQGSRCIHRAEVELTGLSSVCRRQPTEVKARAVYSSAR
jgi:hypothetical protein